MSLRKRERNIRLFWLEKIILKVSIDNRWNTLIDIIAATTERVMLDVKTEAIFHPDEIYFPLYDEDEIRDILRQRVKLGFYKGRMTDEAFDRIVELTLRFGIYLLRMAGIEAERRASRKVEVDDVEKVYEGGAKVFLANLFSPEFG